MNQIPPITVSISSDLPNDERESFLLALRMAGDVQESVNRDLDPASILFIVKVGGTIASSAAALIKLIDAIITWRHNARQRNVEPKVRLHRPNQSPLALERTTDEEVRAWLLQQNPR